MSGQGPEQGFPRSSRLLRKADYESVFKHGYRLSDNGFSVLVRRREDTAGARLGLAISKRTAPRAVDRNRVKRLLRDRFRRSRAGLAAVDLVVLCRQLPPNRQELGRAIDALWRRVESRCVL